MKFRFTKIDLINNLIILDIMLCLFTELLASYYKILTVLNFLPDVCNLFLVILILGEHPIKNTQLKINIRSVSSWMGVFFLIFALTSYLWSDFNLIIAFKRYRYIFAGFLIYYCVKTYLTKEYYERTLKILLGSSVVNFTLVAYQKIVMDLHPDFCNGIFGFKEYNNASLGVFALLVSLLAIAFYLENMHKSRIMIAIIFLVFACLACALAEIKAFFVALVVGAVLVVLPQIKFKTKFKKMLIVASLLIGLLMAAILILYFIMPENLYTFFNLSGYVGYETYGARGGAGRLNQISYIFENDYNNNHMWAIIGQGLGTDSSQYVYELGKSFFNFGVIGLFLLIMFFVSNGVECYYGAKKHKKSEAYSSFALSILMILILMIWNCTLNRACYIVFYFLAIGQGNIRIAREEEK